jgi:hypothetical protein
MLTAAYAKAANESRDFLRHVGPPLSKGPRPVETKPLPGLSRAGACAGKIANG